jgi:AraC-like DNA-binding protein
VTSDHSWRRIQFGLDQLEPFRGVARHQHLQAYATIVLAGSYEQSSYAGRLKVEAGDVLIQPTLDFHSDHACPARLDIIRLPWQREETFGGIYRDLDVAIVERAARCDIFEAANLLKEQLIGRKSIPPAERDWSDKLAADLKNTPSLHIAQWAASNGLTREYASRCFSRDFGVPPMQFRSELSARAAWLAITNSNEPLSKIAADFRFSDQSHMTRAVKALTGVSPARWRTPRSFKAARKAQTGLFRSMIRMQA